MFLELARINHVDDVIIGVHNYLLIILSACRVVCSGIVY